MNILQAEHKMLTIYNELKKDKHDEKAFMITFNESIDVDSDILNKNIEKKKILIMYKILIYIL
jgi:hypothetical protein